MNHNQCDTREKINIYFLGATFQACLHENYILKLVLHWTLCKFTGALFWFSEAILGISGANSPWAPVYFFSLCDTMTTFWVSQCCEYAWSIDHDDVNCNYSRTRSTIESWSLFFNSKIMHWGQDIESWIIIILSCIYVLICLLKCGYFIHHVHVDYLNKLL